MKNGKRGRKDQEEGRKDWKNRRTVIGGKDRKKKGRIGRVG